MAKVRKSDRLHLRIAAEVAREIRQHARSQSKTEVCGVLVGNETEGMTSIEACISGENAAQGGAHVTFTQDTWEHIYKVKDRDYPDARIVGWYHSHPGFGVFLSDHDTFIHKNFFSSPQQVAWVYDPHSDEEGCFGWDGDRLKRIPRINVVDSRGGELAGGSDRPDRGRADISDSDEVESPRKRATESRKQFEDLDNTEDTEVSRLANIVFAVFSYLAVFLIGAILAWYLFHRTVYVAVDPYTGKVIGILQELPPEKTAQPDSAPAQQAQPQPNKPQRDNAH
ncbi:MAG TPA: Mov34/MPN/PAD-1 family protein [Candidatus Dormibacteraeota bacterium]|jgi:proteasome lid subunit RPN8/RPN11|nr:Mov34/MPN/PAD-1 family protein [Candidatus Dormibacteraeota bacterium]